MDIAIIPAFNPDMKLIELVNELYESKIENIIVVNDGSEQSTHTIFEKVRDFAVVLTHNSNRGKGAAIKTALRYVSDHLPDREGIVVLDADGQHRPKDALRLLDKLHNSSADLVLGVRSFTGKIPFRSLIGNTITKYVFRLSSGKWVSDTQTGLRAFSADMVSKLLKVKGERYEYEMNVLLNCAKDGTSITEVPIETIYHDGSNSSSHFKAVRDSIRIYGNILLFSGASFLSFLLDYMMFFPFVWVFGRIGLMEGTALIYGNIAARFISAAFNYYLNSTYVFGDKENRMKSIASYAVLACTILTLNSIILYCFHNLFHLNEAMAKLITEMLLFVISFTVQKFFIFNKVNEKERAIV